VLREEVSGIPDDSVVVVATGPLTSARLAEKIGHLAGQKHLHFFDAMAPIVTADSIDMSVAFRASRYKSGSDAAGSPELSELGDYINCPLTRDEYYAFVDALQRAERVTLRDFEQPVDEPSYFEACLPIEVLAGRDPDALSYGPMRPMGLRDPRTGRRPFAVVQLRQDNLAGTLYNIVGFQTSLRWVEQQRVLTMIPGLQRAEFVRLGQIHRNTFINSPALLRPTLQWRSRDDLLFAGQLTGTEGYVGSIAGGLLAGVNALRIAEERSPVECPDTTMIGALIRYITRASPTSFQPMKANFGLLPDLGVRISDRQRRGSAYAARAISELEGFIRGFQPTAAGDQ
jgi:methylenetetrahydrofolate--tRNA-(uracil-5-)-methyltransferase